MGLFRQLVEKPWQVQTADGPVSNEGSAFPIHRRAVAMYVFLAIVGVLFFLFVAAYHMRIVLSTDWVALPEPPLLWVNTCVLVLCSLAFQRARSTIRRDLIDRARFAFLLAGVLTLVFLAGQMIVWKQLVGMGYFVSTSPANSFFYLITAVHGCHLVGGLLAWVRVAVRMRRQVDASDTILSFDLCAVYWHFLLLVWVGMLALFLTT
ncbi:MAG: cytochrome c oxidase subunit 3 [Pseudomonadota bacterium]|jgi:cytochrome c oxidase subunit 3|nr:cytochrome c oxidase subunit 3 [Pseudomonadota bacterium]|tara:strand:- start:85 stop:705 length:621 start_codon:yes stop_codon:yes gene_type:complete